jgi:prepilin-type N-terminal cleavage/methylation domain-containing protein
MNTSFLKKNRSTVNNFFIRKNFSRVNMKFMQKHNGFTLIEIVIVISIMSVMSVIIYSSFGESRAKSRDQKRISDISTIQLSLEQYFQKNGVYPLTLDELSPTYISSIPTDPTTNIKYSGNYFPMTKNSGSSYCISYQLWTRFEKNNTYLNSKRGFNSLSLPSGMFECGSLHTPKDASNATNPLVYDVMPY